jgi:hypothetical protein
MERTGASKIAVAEFYEIFDEEKRLLSGLGISPHLLAVARKTR